MTMRLLRFPVSMFAFTLLAVSGPALPKRRMTMRLLRFPLSMFAFTLLAVSGLFFTLRAHGQASAAPSPGVVAGGFCTYRTGFLKNSTEAAQRINQYFGLPPNPPGAEFFHVGT